MHILVKLKSLRVGLNVAWVEIVQKDTVDRLCPGKRDIGLPLSETPLQRDLHFIQRQTLTLMDRSGPGQP